MGRRNGWIKTFRCARGLKMLALTRSTALEIVMGGDCLGFFFHMENAYNSPPPPVQMGIFIPPQRQLPRSMAAAYPSGSYSEPVSVISLPLIFT